MNVFSFLCFEHKQQSLAELLFVLLKLNLQTIDSLDLKKNKNGSRFVRKFAEDII